MTTITKRAIKTTAKIAAAKADAFLVKTGQAAQMRQRKRATKAALKTAGKVMLVAGTAAATVVTARAVMRNVRRTTTVE